MTEIPGIEDLSPEDKMAKAKGLFTLARICYSPKIGRQAAELFHLGASELTMDDAEAQGFFPDDIIGMTEERIGEIAAGAFERIRELREQLHADDQTVLVAPANEHSTDYYRSMN